MSSKYLFAFHAVVAASVSYLIDTQLPDPYMDEIFHVTQACRYATEGFKAPYDPKLTTPSGLYVFPSTLIRIINSLTTINLQCTPKLLRKTNLFLIFLLPSLIRASSPRKMGLEESLIISTFPLGYFFTFLFYTDLLSLASVLATLVVARQGRWTLVATLGIASLAVRQTNIIWIGFVGAWTLFDRLKEVELALNKDGHKKGAADIDIYSDDSSHAIVHLFRLLAHIPSSPKLRKAIFIPIAAFTPVILSFAAFIVWNNGQIVLGDASNHVPILHIPQIFYFIAFSTAFSFPLWYDGVGTIRSIGSNLLKTSQRRISSAIILRIMFWAVQRFTYVHPFLLSDNRHYTFYIWRRLLSKSVIRYSAVPLYLVSIPILSENSALPPILRILFAICTFVTLVPTPLIEFRYFLTPYILWRLSTKRREGWRMRTRMEGLLYGIINLLTIGVFLKVKFKWESEKEEEKGWMRFMW